jgi:hypothetical protein
VNTHELPMSFWAFPAAARTTLTARQLKEALLQHDGRLLAHGRLWDIVSKKIGPGVYEVSLRERA